MEYLLRIRIQSKMCIDLVANANENMEIDIDRMSIATADY